MPDDEAGRKAQLEYRDYACRSRLWQGKPQPNLAVVGVLAIRRDEHGTPSGLTVEYAKPFADGAPNPAGGFYCTRGSRTTRPMAWSRSCKTTVPYWTGWARTNCSSDCSASRRAKST